MICVNAAPELHRLASTPILLHQTNQHGGAPGEDSAGPDYFVYQAKRCRRLAGTIGDSVTVETLTRMAAEYEEKAGVAERPL